MPDKIWNAWAGIFSSPWNWSPSAAPAAGDNLYIQNGTAMMVGQTFGSDSARSTIGLTGQAASDAPTLVVLDATLKNVLVDTASESPGLDYSPAKYGTLARIIH